MTQLFRRFSTAVRLKWHMALQTGYCKDLTCYSKAPFVKFYSIIHKMCYNLHGSSSGLDYTVVRRQTKRIEVICSSYVSYSHCVY